MQRDVGRLVDHLRLGVADLEASRRFYRACLAALGVELDADAADHFAAGELSVERADGPASRVHLVFRAADRAAVERFHAAGLAAGGVDAGAPGARGDAPCDYAAQLRDPDGNTVEAVHRGTAPRPAGWVETTPGLA